MLDIREIASAVRDTVIGSSSVERLLLHTLIFHRFELAKIEAANG